MTARFDFDGGWCVRADSGGGWVIGRPVVRKDKTGKDVESMPDATYPATLPNALGSLLERKIAESDARTLEEVRDMILAFRREVAALFEVGAP